MYEIGSKSLPVSFGLFQFHIVWATNSTIQQMQNIQNYGAKLVLGRSKYDNSKEALAELHWLPVKSRIKVKILVLVFKCLRRKAPEYLMNLLVRCTELTYNLRSSNIKDRLVIPRTVRQTFTPRSFSVAGPTLWNRLPNCIKNSKSLDLFKKNSRHSYLPTVTFRITFIYLQIYYYTPLHNILLY